MTTVEKVEEAVREYERSRGADDDLIRLRDFLAKMKEEGLLIKREYDLPTLDTVGRTAYETKRS